MTVRFGLDDDFTKEISGQSIISPEPVAIRHESYIKDAIAEVSAISADGIVVKRSSAVILATEIFGSSETGDVSEIDFTDSFDNLFLIKFSRILKELKSCKNSLKRFKEDLSKPRSSVIINEPFVKADPSVKRAFEDAEIKASEFKDKLVSYRNYLIKNLVDKEHLMYGKTEGKKKSNLSRVLSFVILFFGDKNAIQDVFSELTNDFKKFKVTPNTSVDSIVQLYKLLVCFEVIDKGISECIKVVFNEKTKPEESELVSKMNPREVDFSPAAGVGSSEVNSIGIYDNGKMGKVHQFMAKQDVSGTITATGGARFSIIFDKKDYDAFSAKFRGVSVSDKMSVLIDTLLSTGKMSIYNRFGFDASEFKKHVVDNAEEASFDDTDKKVFFFIPRSDLNNYLGSPEKLLEDQASLRDGDEVKPVIKVNVKGSSKSTDGLNAIVYSSFKNEEIKKEGQATTTSPFYQTKDPDGHTVTFTPNDLVAGRGKIKSKKGKYFKPKKWKSSSLKDKVNSWKPKGK